MVTVKLFGLFRLDSGLKELRAEAGTVKALYPVLLAAARETNPGSTVTAADLDGCIVVINGRQGQKNSRLNDGDVVYLMSPVCGG